MPYILKDISFTNKEHVMYSGMCNCNIYFNLIHKIINYLNVFARNNSKLRNNINISPYFHVGFLNLISALGGIRFKIFDLVEDVNLLRYDKTEIDEKLNLCCLYHFLISLEKSCSAIDSYKMKISNFINKSRFSDNFLDFLCKTLSFSGHFDEAYRNGIINHPWIKVNNFINLNNNYSRVKISFKELLKIVREGKSAKNFGQDSLNTKNFCNFLNSLEIILYNNNFINYDDVFNATILKKKVIKELSRQIGINRNELIIKIQNQIKSTKR